MEYCAYMFAQTVNIGHVSKHDIDDISDIPQAREGEILDGPAEVTEKPLPLRALLTRPVVVSVANYCMIGLLDIMGAALIPLVWSTSVEFGGLGMSPASIGVWLAGCGFLNGIFQFVAFPRIIRRFGTRRVFIASTLCFFPIYTLLPFENLALRGSTHGLNLTAALLIALQLMMTCLSSMGFGAIFMYVSSAPPNRRSLGATNGISQTMIAIQRTIGPVSAASLFAFSLDSGILGGNFAYVVALATVWVGLGVAMQLPENTWKQNKQ